MDAPFCPLAGKRSRGLHFGWASLALLLLMGWVFHPWSAVSGGYITLEEETVAAVKKVKPCVVNITTSRPGAGEGIGSGVIISKDGYVLTNTHVIKDAKTIIVTFSNGKKLNAMVVRASPDRDLAVIKVNAQGLPVPKFADSAKLRLGQMAIAIGNPLRFAWTVTTGCVSALNRDIKAKGILYRDLIQTDAAINPGSSGGALVNSNGEVIGINTLVFTGGSKYQHVAGLSFAIPINEAMRTANYLIKGKGAVVPKPWIGITGIDVTEDIAEAYDLPVKSGVLVDSVVAFGPASKAGIEPGDIITEMNGQMVRTVEGFKALLNNTRPGEQIDLTVWHQGRKTRIKVTVEQLSQ